MKHKRNYETVAWTRVQHPETGKLFRITLELDKGALLDWYASKALRNKSGETRDCNGDIRVRATLVEK